MKKINSHPEHVVTNGRARRNLIIEMIKTVIMKIDRIPLTHFSS